MLEFKDLENEVKFYAKKEQRFFNPNFSGTSDIPIGVSIPTLKELAKKYKNLNLEEFKIDGYFEYRFLYFLIAFLNFRTFEETISFIKDNSSEYIGWGLTDSTYQFIPIKKDFNETFKIIKKLSVDENQYIRRLAYLLCFKYKKDKANLNKIFSLFKNDGAYYVQMVESWLLCELYIYHFYETFIFLETAKLDKIIINKAISKIRDSYRISKENKEKVKEIRR